MWIVGYLCSLDFENPAKNPVDNWVLVSLETHPKYPVLENASLIDITFTPYYNWMELKS